MFMRRTIKEALDNAWSHKWAHSKGARKKAQLMRVVAAELGTRRLSGFGYNDVDDWVRALRDRDLAVATIRSRVSCLYFALGLAVKKGWLKAVPPSPDLETSSRKLRWLSDAEAKRLLAACDTQRHEIATVMRDVLTFLLDTGARLGELIKVREPDLTEQRGKTYVEFTDRKAGDNLRIPLTMAARDALYRLLASDYWKGRTRGTVESAKRCNSAQNWLTHRFTEIRDAAKLPDVTAHTLRHTFASRLVQAGVDIYHVQKLLGHSDIRQTERYSHLNPASLDKAITVLEPVPDNVTKLPERRIPGD
jgi:integrase